MGIRLTYRLERDYSKRHAFEGYSFRICKGDGLVARYLHDYRGDEHAIDFADGTSESCPVGHLIDILEGGGPKPLLLADGRGVSRREGEKP